jgi:hypothetical protein
MTEFNFLDQFDSIIEATAQTVEKPKTVDVADILRKVFGDDKSVAIVLRSGISWSEFKIAKYGKEPARDVFKRMKPTERGEQFDLLKIKSYFVLRCCIAGLCAQNKGKISTADIFSLYIGLCQPYKPVPSLKAIVTKIAQDLYTSAESTGDYVYIAISGNKFANYVPVANKIIASVKSAANNW